MLAEFDVEIGPGAPRLVVPWAADDGSVKFLDLRAAPELSDTLAEARTAAMRTALFQLNSHGSFFTAKCDLWSTHELDEEEQIFAADWKHSSYIDVVPHSATERTNFAGCEAQMRKWVLHLRRSPLEQASVSVVLRECSVEGTNGYYWSVYVSGFGESEHAARQIWADALTQTVAVLCGDAL